MTITYKSIKQRKYGSLKLNRWAKQQPALMRKAFRVIGSIVARQITRNLSGESHSRNPQTTNPYPGVVTGILRRSIRWILEKPTGVRITTGGLAQEYAADVNAVYPFMLPSFEQKEEEVWRILKRFTTKPLR